MAQLNLIPITQNQKSTFIQEAQSAFQKSYEDLYGKRKEMIMPTEDIESSFDAEGSEAYFAILDNEIVGGTIVVIDPENKMNQLHLLYVKVGIQNKGTGQKIWQAIEDKYPNALIWETHTPYYDKRNIHFYVNRCGFKIVEFFNAKHKDPHQINDQVGGLPPEISSDFFRFEKEKIS